MDFYRIKLLTPSSKHPPEHRDFCFEKNLFAIGWEVDGNINTIEDYENAAKIKYCKGKNLSGNINSSYKNIKNMEIGDYIWTQKDARTYYLGKVDSEILFDSDYANWLGLTRSCGEWKEINFNEVPGIVTSYFAGSGQVLVCCNRLNESEDIKKYCEWLYNKTKGKPKISDYKNLLHYDDLEDLLGLFLQYGEYNDKKYYIHPSTNKLSTKAIEYELRSEDGEKIGIQCKIGDSSVDSNTLTEFTQKGYTILVATKNDNDCVGENIKKIPIDVLWTFAKKHQEILTDRIKNYISLTND